MTVLVFNALLHIFTLLYSWKVYKFNLYTFLWLYYTIYSILGVIVVTDGVYFEQIQILNRKISFIPYLLNYICTFLMIFPLRKISSNSVKIPSVKYLNKFNSLFRFLLLIYIVYLVERLYELSFMSQLSLGDRYAMMAGEGEELMSNNILLIYIRKITGLIYFATFPFSLFYVISYMIHGRKKNVHFKHQSLYLTVCVLPYIIISLIGANRNELYFLLLRLFLFVFLFFSFFPHATKKRIVLYSMIIGLIIINIVLAISVSRFDSGQDSALESILRYLGESYPNLGYVYWNRVIQHPMGLSMYPEIYDFFTGYTLSDNNIGFFEKYSFWEFFTGVPTLYFKSIFGSLYIEFGTIGALLFIVIIYAIMSNYLKKNNYVTVSSISFIYFYFIACCKSVMGYPFSIKQLQILLGMIVFGYLIKRYTNKQIVK